MSAWNEIGKKLFPSWSQAEKEVNQLKAKLDFYIKGYDKRGKLLEDLLPPEERNTIRIYIAYLTIDGITHKVAFTGLYFTMADEGVFSIGNASPESPFNGIPAHYSNSLDIMSNLRAHGAGILTYLPYRDLEHSTILIVDWYDAYLGRDLTAPSEADEETREELEFDGP